jgi:hypothetical protein
MLDTFIEDVRSRQKEFVVYTEHDDPEVAERFAEHNVSVEYRPLPTGTTDGFLVIREDGAFVGGMALEKLETLLEPPITRPESIGTLSEVYQALFDVFDETVFTALTRRQLLAASREIEDRAYRVGHGTFRVGFQSGAAFRDQRSVYERLADETDLDIHVYGKRDWPPPVAQDLTVHRSDDRISRFWFLAFDGGTEESQACALVAKQTNDEYTGFWTYEFDIVTDILTEVARID